MGTTALVQIGVYLATLAGGYLLRHYGVGLPLLPSPTSVPAVPSSGNSSTASSSGVDHVGLLQQVLGAGKGEAEALLQQAVRAVIAKALADAQAAVPQAPTASPKS